MRELFNSDKKPVAVLFEKLTLKRDKDGNRIAAMRFAVPLTPEVALGLTQDLEFACNAIQNHDASIYHMDIAQELEHVNVKFFPLPGATNCCAELQDVRLVWLAMEKVATSTVPYLLFTVPLKINGREKLRHWMVDSVFSQQYARFRFQAAQLEIATEVKRALGSLQDLAERDGTTITLEMGGKSAIIADGTKPYADPDDVAPTRLASRRTRKPQPGPGAQPHA